MNQLNKETFKKFNELSKETNQQDLEGKTKSIVLFEEENTEGKSKFSVLTLSKETDEFSVSVLPAYIDGDKILPGQMVGFVNEGSEIITKRERPESQALRLEQIADAMNHLVENGKDYKNLTMLRATMLAMFNVAWENADFEKIEKARNKALIDRHYDIFENISLKDCDDKQFEEAVKNWIDVNKMFSQSKRFTITTEQDRIANRNNFGKDGGMFKTEY